MTDSLPEVPSTACMRCRGEEVIIGPEGVAIRCPRCQGSGRELAALMGVDRIRGHSGHAPKV